MNRHCALLWDEKTVFSRFIEECGLTCEHVTPPSPRGTLLQGVLFHPDNPRRLCKPLLFPAPAGVACLFGPHQEVY